MKEYTRCLFMSVIIRRGLAEGSFDEWNYKCLVLVSKLS